MLPIELTTGEFEDCSKEVCKSARAKSYLAGWVQICGIHHHVDLVEVAEDDSREAVNDHCQKYLDALEAFSDGDPVKTVTLNKRRYVVIITPFNA